MEQALTLFAWFSGILILVTTIIDILLAFKFKRYFRANGFGIVTLTLLSLIISHAIGTLVFGMTSLTIIITTGEKEDVFYALKDFGTLWLMSSTLLHVMGFTFQRVFSFSYGNKFLHFTRSKTNIGLLVLFMWVASLIITLIGMTSRKPSTFSVYYIGVFITGILTVVNFIITVETSIFKEKTFETGLASPTTSIRMNEQDKVRVVQNPRKTFSLFSGLVLSFIVFFVPACIPNLIFNLRGKMLAQSTSLVVSLWILLGVVFNCMWVLMRLRSTVNDTSGFYARWTLRKSRENLSMMLKKQGKKEGKSRLLNNELDDSIDNKTEAGTLERPGFR